MLGRLPVGYQEVSDVARRRILDYYMKEEKYWPTINNFLQGRILADLSDLQVSQLHANLARKELRERINNASR